MMEGTRKGGIGLRDTLEVAERCIGEEKEEVESEIGAETE